MVEIVSAKLISHILVDFTSESDMELYKKKKRQNRLWTEVNNFGHSDVVRLKSSTLSFMPNRILQKNFLLLFPNSCTCLS